MSRTWWFIGLAIGGILVGAGGATHFRPTDSIQADIRELRIRVRHNEQALDKLPPEELKNQVRRIEIKLEALTQLMYQHFSKEHRTFQGSSGEDEQ